ncbi:DNA polymerase I [uncultured Selenomonas sp.]|uniref:DNA polymerase I n=1 Tax=uncultured Selenomonas sp. TaxID=159275 RepID=UPI0025EE1B78|nr:DNA polymerase I [uncultured Selenomonas sp.]
MKRFVILDGSSLFFRAFFAIPPLTAPTGEYTNAIFGFATMFLKLVEELQPDELVIAFDKSRHTFRTELYPDYKGTRSKTPDELKSQIPLLEEFAGALGVTFLEKDNYEADDIIGTLATQAAAAGYEAMVVTGDRDALQLVRPNLRVLMTKKGITDLKSYDEATFTEEYQMPPIKLIDLKGLMGDTSDNIPGVPGVGPKTATKLLLAYGSLESVLNHVDEVKGKKLKENLTTFADQARLSKTLATIDCNVPGLAAPGAYEVHPDEKKFIAFCQRYNLNAVLARGKKLFAKSATSVVEEKKEEEKAGDALVLAADNESVAGNAKNVSTSEKTTAAAKKKTAKPADSADVPDLSSVDVITQDVHIVFDWKACLHAGVTFDDGKRVDDLQLMAYLLHPEATEYTLPSLLAEFFPNEIQPEAFTKADIEHAFTKLLPPMRARLDELGLTKLYEDIELPLAPVLYRMENTGVYVNRDHLREKAEVIGDKIKGLEDDIYTLAGHEFKINSPKQLATVLFDEIGLKPIKKTKTGYSTNAEVLEQLRYEHPIIECILSYRLWTKLKSTYLDGIAGLINEETGRVHTSFNQTVTATGRLSSSDPNLQNIPVRTEQGKEIRALFEPGPGYDAMLSADYSQIELRLLAHMSGDPSFIEAFREGQDIHARTAAEVFHVPLADVTPEERRKAKAVNFGIVYGISDFGLSRDLHITRKEAAGYIDEYFTRYPGVKSFMDKVVAEAHTTGAVTTMYGRRRELPAIHSKNFNQRSLAERMAMNTPIQGTAADIIKIAMIRADQMLREANVKSRILLQVHDELVLEVVNEEIPKVTAILKEAMEHAAELSVPLVIDVNVGKNWAEAK